MQCKWDLKVLVRIEQPYSHQIEERFYCQNPESPSFGLFSEVIHDEGCVELECYEEADADE